VDPGPGVPWHKRLRLFRLSLGGKPDGWITLRGECVVNTFVTEGFSTGRSRSTVAPEPDPISVKIRPSALEERQSRDPSGACSGTRGAWKADRPRGVAPVRSGRAAAGWDRAWGATCRGRIHRSKAFPRPDDS
jgi:hypothetical protein